MLIREDRKSVIFQEKSCFSRRKTIEMKDGLSIGLKQKLDRDIPSYFHLFISEDRKSVICRRKFDLSLAIKKQTAFRQNLSYNFHLLSMLRD